MKSNQMPTILIVDDDVELLENAKELLETNFIIRTAFSVKAAKAILRETAIDVAIVDLNFEGQEEDGIVLLDFISHETPDVEVVVLSFDKLTSRVVAAMRRNLVDFITKAGDYEDALKLAINRALENRRARLEKQSQHTFMTKSEKMRDLIRFVYRIANSPHNFSILITGESGTGKEVLVRFIAGILGKHYVAHNMAGVPEAMAESELLGHLRGSFTGAVANKPGLIEQAHNGIFFLDEIGECTLPLQAKLLRVIQEKEVTPVGGVKAKKIDVRFISATNRDLEEMIRDKTFREDLFQRINTVHLRIPALRERPEDIVLYANHFLQHYSHGQPFVSLAPSAMNALMAHSWPGNVRELEHVIERVLIHADSRIIDGELVQMAIERRISSGAATENRVKRQASDEAPDRGIILKALEGSCGNRTKAAKALNIHTVTLQRWLKKYGISDVFKPKTGRPSILGGQMKPARVEVQK
jgi:hypothetical protein